MSRCCLYLLALLGCQGKPSQSTAALPTSIEVKDASGTTVAELRPLRPCRATIGPVELIVGGPPLISQHGSTKWTGTSEANGTIVTRDGERIARVYPVGDPAAGAVFDVQGVALARISVQGTTATVSDASSVPIRKLTKQGAAITSDQPALTITGTDDLVLAALLSAPELVPEVRMLAACERVLVKGS